MLFDNLFRDSEVVSKKYSTAEACEFFFGVLCLQGGEQARFKKLVDNH